MLIFYLCRNHPGIGAALYTLSYLPALWNGWAEDPLCLTLGGWTVDWSFFAILAAPLIFAPAVPAENQQVVLLRLLPPSISRSSHSFKISCNPRKEENTMLTVKDLHKSYQVGKTTYEVLKGVSLSVETGSSWP